MTTVDGEEIGPDVSLLLFRGSPVRLADELPAVLDAADTWNPGFLSRPVLWVLLGLVVLVVPLGVLWAYASVPVSRR